jgi:hypothetical protein
VRWPKEIFARWLSKIITPNFPSQRSFLKQFSQTEIQSADKFLVKFIPCRISVKVKNSLIQDEFQIPSNSQTAALLSYFSRTLLRSKLILGQAKNLLA